jgi:hypothetical protein
MIHFEWRKSGWESENVFYQVIQTLWWILVAVAKYGLVLSGILNIEIVDLTVSFQLSSACIHCHSQINLSGNSSKAHIVTP